MAILRSDDFELEMSLRWGGYTDGIVYDVVFKWQGIPVVNGEILDRGGKWWSQRKPGGFIFSEYAKCRPVAFLRKMLDADKSGYEEPVGPDVRITVRPIHAFPEDRSKVIWESEDTKRQREERERRKKELGKLPDDLFEIHFFVDTYNFKGCDAYSGDGITFNFLVERTDFEKFVEQLEAERQVIVEEHRLRDGQADW